MQVMGELSGPRPSGRMLRRAAIERCGALLVSGLLAVLGAAPASAATIETVLEPFTGGAASVLVSISDEADGLAAGDLWVSVHVLDHDEGPGRSGSGGIRGLFLDISDDSLLAALQVSGLDVTGFRASAGDVINLQGGVNLNGGGSPCPCDLGVEIGTPGRNGDFIQWTAFTLSHPDVDLDLSLFFEQSLGVRLSPVSSKLGGALPIPEPSTGLLVGLGAVALAASARARRRARPPAN